MTEEDDFLGMGASIVLNTPMKLQQGQIWKKGEDYFRIVEWERLSVKYKIMQDPVTAEGTMHTVTKKEICRLLKGAELLTTEP